MKWLKRLLAFLPAALVGVLYALCTANETYFLIYHGVGAYRAIRTGLLAALIVALGLGLTVLLVPLFKAAAKRRQARHDLEITEEIRRVQAENAVFAQKNGRWDEARIRDHLDRRINSINTPPALMDYLLRYQAQMDRMNTWQARLSNLINTNAATDLHRAEDLLDRLEQNLLGRLRKAFNWIQVTDMTDAAITPELRANLTQIGDENDVLLDKARALCETLTNYLNTQNEDRAGPVQLDNFIFTLNEQIEEEKDPVY